MRGHFSFLMGTSMGKWPDFEYHGGKWIKYDRSSFNSSKATLGFCRRGSSENNKKLQCVKVKMEQGLVSPKRFRPDWASCSMADTWVTVWGSHGVIKKRFEIPLLTLAPPGGVEVRYTITFMSYTEPQNIYTWRINQIWISMRNMSKGCFQNFSTNKFRSSQKVCFFFITKSLLLSVPCEMKITHFR